jgi:hypothetical protein
MMSLGFASASAFAAGMALAWTAAIAHRIERNERAVGWTLFAYSAAALGFAEFFALLTVGDSAAELLRFAQLGLACAGWILLIEFGRRELGSRYQTLKQPWVYAVLVGAAAIKFALAGAAGLEAVSAYVFAPLGGLLAAVALAQRAQRRRVRGWGLPLMAAAVAFVAIGFALSIAALQAFSALGLLAGIWRERRDKSPFPEHASALVRWRAPGAFVLLTVLGCAALAARQQQDSLIVVQARATGGAAQPASTAIVFDESEIDSRHLARERDLAQRYKQGLSILIVVVVVGAVWVGLSRWQRRM